MSMHKLTAGSGYDYLTRQVAALDATDKGHVGLADYYSAKGESPGRWVGAGMDGIDGLAAGDPVTAEQMQALFGAGLHPLAAERLAAILDAEFSTKVAEGSRAVGGAVQGPQQRRLPVPGRRRPTVGAAEPGRRAAGGLVGAGGGAGPDPH
jgi:hypothetical protein